MKVWDIAAKDLYRSFRSAFFLVFALAMPLLTAALFHFAFSGLASGEDGFELPETRVQVVNLDEAQMGFSAGQILADVLGEAIPGTILVTEVADAAAARAAVDRQEAAVAVIIPAGFTAAVFAPDGQAAVELYQDPTLTLGPSIVKSIVNPLVDGFAGSKIATAVAYEQLTAEGVAVDDALMQGMAMQYAAWSASLGEGQQEGTNPLLDIEHISGGEEESSSGMTMILGQIMAGMMVFFVFFGGAVSAQSILQEEEAGTLPRLFTTPTPQSSILGGKFVATFVTLLVQVVVLVVASALIFDLDWGQPLGVALVTVGVVVLASSFGIFITSWLKDSRQAGIVTGGLLTVLGMIGMIGTFTAGVPGTSKVIDTASLAVPQGWGVRGWKLLLEGAPAADVYLTVAVMLAAGALFFVIGVFRFRKRYA